MTELPRGRAARLVEQNLRFASARLTHQIVLRRGRSLRMTVGCGFPKSGTVWLCQLLGTALGVPYPRDYQAPIMMPAVIHAHWRYDPRIQRAAYIVRDGRDVMVSLYFHYLRVIEMDRNPTRTGSLRRRLEEIAGPGGDLRDVRANMPRFLKSELRATPSSPLPWHEHVQDWSDRPGVSIVRYEDLLTRPVEELARVVAELEGETPARAVVETAVGRHAFEHVAGSGRQAGTEDRTSFLRKGIAGDWSNHFTREAGEVFDHIAGARLVNLGYAQDRNWYLSL